jgi:pimeloyl-ACP methyl ester carboxylesterase
MDRGVDHPWTRRSLLAAAALASAVGGSSTAAEAQAGAAPDLIQLNSGQPPAPWTDEGFVAVAAGRIHWLAMGQGTHVLLLPKLGGWAADWRQVAPLLAGDHRVIVMDPPGHGASSMAGPPPFLLTQEESATMLMKALDVLGVARCAIVGNSMGGSLGLVMSVLWPHRVSKLAMISTAVPPALSLAAIAAAPSNHVFEGEFTYDKARSIFFSNHDTWEDHRRSMAQATPWVGASERGVRRAGLSDYFTRTPTAPLMIYGERASQGGYRAFLPDLKRRRPDMTVAEIPDAGTFTHQDNPAATAEVLKAFLT